MSLDNAEGPLGMVTERRIARTSLVKADNNADTKLLKFLYPLLESRVCLFTIRF